jgi:hypothetical protein
MKQIKTSIFALALLLTVASCNTMVHTVGTGGAGGEKTSQKQWYILFGLVPLNKVDSKSMANGATNYTVTTQNSFVDQVISIFTGIVTVHPATVTVTK